MHNFRDFFFIKYLMDEIFAFVTILRTHSAQTVAKDLLRSAHLALGARTGRSAVSNRELPCVCDVI